VLAACTAVDLREFPGGISNVQECDPTFVKGEEGLQRLVGILRGYVAAGGMELSLNFLSEAQLRAAQADPDAHVHLMVRLFGLSARFVSLSPALQESVIERVRAAEKKASSGG
jgi:formate C-acetyltransferase